MCAEIVELTELLQPAPEEVEARRAAVEEIRQVVVSIWPTASVTVFGSFATGEASHATLVLIQTGLL